MAIFSFFKAPKHRTFNFKPRYYDERKERLEEIVRNSERELGINKEGGQYHTRITKGYMRKFMDDKRSDRKASNTRLLIIIAALLVLLFFMLS